MAVILHLLSITADGCTTASDWVQPVKFSKRAAAHAETGLTIANLADDRCTALTGHTRRAASGLAFRGLLLPMTTGGARSIAEVARSGLVARKQAFVRLRPSANELSPGTLRRRCTHEPLTHVNDLEVAGAFGPDELFQLHRLVLSDAAEGEGQLCPGWH